MENQERTLLLRKYLMLMQSELYMSQADLKRLGDVGLLDEQTIKAIQDIDESVEKTKLFVDTLLEKSYPDTINKLNEALSHHFTTNRVADELGWEIQLGRGEIRPSKHTEVDCKVLIHKIYGTGKRLSEVEKKELANLCAERTDIQNRVWSMDIERLTELGNTEEDRHARKRKMVLDLCDKLENILIKMDKRLNTQQETLLGLSIGLKDIIMRPPEGSIDRRGIDTIYTNGTKLIQITTGALLEVEAILKDRNKTFMVLKEMMKQQNQGEHPSEIQAVWNIFSDRHEEDVLDTAENRAFVELEVRKNNNEEVSREHDEKQSKLYSDMEKHRIKHASHMQKLNIMEEAAQLELDQSFDRMLQWRDINEQVDEDFTGLTDELVFWKTRVEELESGKMLNRIYFKDEQRKAQKSQEMLKVRKDNYANLPRFRLPEISFADSQTRLQTEAGKSLDYSEGSSKSSGPGTSRSTSRATWSEGGSRSLVGKSLDYSEGTSKSSGSGTSRSTSRTTWSEGGSRSNQSARAVSKIAGKPRKDSPREFDGSSPRGDI